MNNLLSKTDRKNQTIQYRISFSNSESEITSYSYDSLNRLTSLADPTTGTFGFGYDALGRRTSLTRPNGVGTSYTYGKNGARDTGYGTRGRWFGSRARLPRSQYCN